MMRGFVRATYPANTEPGALPDPWGDRPRRRDGTTGRTLSDTSNKRMGWRARPNRQNGRVDSTTEAPGLWITRASRTEEDLESPAHESTESDRPWIVLVWNDPINLMSYVSFVFQKLFGYSKEKADSLMLDVHEKGRAVVSTGPRERAEIDVFRLHEHGLWATMQKDE